ncbi:beta-ketoacyl reductase, partial [Streptomyces sparsus]
PEQAGVWGLGRVAALEHPDRWGGLIDLPSEPDQQSLHRLTGALGGAEDQIAIREGRTLARRLLRAPAPTTTSLGAWKPSGRVLVTGGTGSLGAHTARWLAEHGAEEIVLTSRRGEEAPGTADLVAELRRLGASHVHVAACDVADRDAVAALLAEYRVNAVFHAAGVPDAKPLDEIDDAYLDSVWRAKAAGAAHLDELTCGWDLGAFVVFSSIAGVWGSGGQGAYAAANAFVDALVEGRCGRGVVGTSVAWGPWSGGGMVSGVGAVELGRRGLRVMDPGRALVGLGCALEVGDGAVVVADVDWERFVPTFTSSRPSPLLTTFAPPAHTTAADSGGADATRARLVSRLAEMPEAERRRALRELVQGRATAVLGRTADRTVDLGRAFRDVGFDSLTAVEFRNQLGAETGLRLPATLLFDYPTPRHLADHLYGQLFPEQPDTAVVDDADEELLRRRIAAVPLSRWRESGLITALLSVAEATENGGSPDRTEPHQGAATTESAADGAGEPEGGGEDVIQAMDVDALVQLALRDPQS